ncbi:transglutaminase-like cysteine peptidase [Spongiibacter sp.]|uniref:transglutaminase-like cysteine peptidase n=1 Tax=Spongiibacter sp. TaxID=2024860 RepID=UPI00356A00CF
MLLIAINATTANFHHFGQLADMRYGQPAATIAMELSTLLGQLGQAGTAEQLEQVNRFFNDRIQFRDDIKIWGESDYWASPLEMIGQGAGDCEDFSIAKYTALKLLGIPISKLRLTYVKLNYGGQGQAHMVLSYYERPGDVPLILDNLVNSIRPATERPDLKPVFGFNSEGLWIGNSGGPAKYDPKARMSRWREVLLKIQNEGLD